MPQLEVGAEVVSAQPIREARQPDVEGPGAVAGGREGQRRQSMELV